MNEFYKLQRIIYFVDSTITFKCNLPSPYYDFFKTHINTLYEKGRELFPKLKDVVVIYDNNYYNIVSIDDIDFYATIKNYETGDMHYVDILRLEKL